MDESKVVMKKLIIIFFFVLFGCASHVPADIQRVYNQVNREIVYDIKAPKWSVNPIKKDIFGFKYRLGSCSNYVLLYYNRLRERGNHVKLEVKDFYGKVWILDSAKRFIIEKK